MKAGRLAFDGIFCGTDKLAVAVIKMLRRMGQRVPEDVQVIGYDGLRAFGDQEYYCSTIIQPVEDLGQAAGEQILRRVEVPDAPIFENVLTSTYRPSTQPRAWSHSDR